MRIRLPPAEFYIFYKLKSIICRVGFFSFILCHFMLFSIVFVVPNSMYPDLHLMNKTWYHLLILHKLINTVHWPNSDIRVTSQARITGIFDHISLITLYTSRILLLLALLLFNRRQHCVNLISRWCSGFTGNYFCLYKHCVCPLQSIIRR